MYPAHLQIQSISLSTTNAFKLSINVQVSMLRYSVRQQILYDQTDSFFLEEPNKTLRLSIFLFRRAKQNTCLFFTCFHLFIFLFRWAKKKKRLFIFHLFIFNLDALNKTLAYFSYVFTCLFFTCFHLFIFI